jgi:ribonuclease-3
MMPRISKSKDAEAKRVFFEKGLADLEDALGHRFERKELARDALTHSSFAAETGKASYERLEFLGDRVVELAVSEWLYRNRSDDEGDMAKVLGWLVDEESLGGVARELGLEGLIRLGRSYAGGKPSSSVLADSFEAVIGALFVDAGPETASRIVVSHLLKDGRFGGPPEDYLSRSLLEERCRKEGLALPTFAHRERGPDHEKEFECTVILEGDLVGKGKGRTKKEAERRASADLLKKLS